MRPFILFLSLCLPLSAATIVNEGLNMLPANVGSTVTVGGGSSYNGWTNDGAVDIEFVGVSAAVTPSDEGDGFVDLNGVSGPGRLSQTITTMIGQSYRIDFALSGNPGATGDRLGDKPMSVLWNSSSVGNFTHTHLSTERHNNLRWLDQSVLVVGTGSDILTFLSTGGASDAGAMIDDVTITLVPEPSSSLMLGFGIFGILFRRMRR